MTEFGHINGEYEEWLSTYHPGTGAMVAMGCEDDGPHGDPYGNASGLPRYNDDQLMTQIGYDQSGLRYNDNQLMTQIGYEMYSEYGASDAQVIPYTGFGPSMAQTDYPHGPFDEPDMGFEPFGPRRGDMDTHGAMVNGGLAAGGAAIGLHFGGPPGALIGAAIGGAVRSLIGR